MRARRVDLDLILRKASRGNSFWDNLWGGIIGVRKSSLLSDLRSRYANLHEVAHAIMEMQSISVDLLIPFDSLIFEQNQASVSLNQENGICIEMIKRRYGYVLNALQAAGIFIQDQIDCTLLLMFLQSPSDLPLSNQKDGRWQII